MEIDLKWNWSRNLNRTICIIVHKVRRNCTKMKLERIELEWNKVSLFIVYLVIKKATPGQIVDVLQDDVTTKVLKTTESVESTCQTQ